VNEPAQHVSDSTSLDLLLCCTTSPQQIESRQQVHNKLYATSLATSWTTLSPQQVACNNQQVARTTCCTTNPQLIEVME